MHRILLVDDEPGVLSALSRVLRHARLSGSTDRQPRIEACSCGEEALQKASTTAYDLVVSDYRMPGMSGVELLKRIRDLQPNCARVVLSGYADLNALIAAINDAHIDRFIAKPWNDYEFVSALTQVLEIRALRLENEALADRKRCEEGRLSATDLELKRLEALEPGITQVQWGPDGSIVIELDSSHEF